MTTIRKLRPPSSPSSTDHRVRRARGLIKRRASPYLVRPRRLTSPPLFIPLPPRPSHRSATRVHTLPPYFLDDSLAAHQLKGCDSCKVRKVKCVRESGGMDSTCGQCWRMGISCTVTPIVRKAYKARSGRRVELAKAQFGSASEGDSPPTLNTPPRIDDSLALVQYEASLGSHLLTLFRLVPQAWISFFPHTELALEYELANRRVELLAPQSQALALAVMAYTSYLSDHPVLFDPDSLEPSIPSLFALNCTPEFDLLRFGRRRSSVCGTLRDRAIQKAWDSGTLALASPQSAASCYILSLLLERSPGSFSTSAKPYWNSFANHARQLSVMGMPPDTEWRWLVLIDALESLNSASTPGFALGDWRILVGPTPISLEDILLDARATPDVPRPLSTLNTRLNPFLFHLTATARTCVELLTGAAARCDPFNEPAFHSYLSTINNFPEILSSLNAHVSHHFQGKDRLAYAVDDELASDAGVRFALFVTVASFALPVQRELQRRIIEIAESTSSSDPVLRSERRRRRDHLVALRTEVERHLVVDAQIVATAIRDAPSLAVMTHLVPLPLGKWAEFLLGVSVTEDGGIMSRAERRSALEAVLSGIRSTGWSWTGGEAIAASLEDALAREPFDFPDTTAQVTPPSLELELDFASGWDALTQVGGWPEGRGDVDATQGAFIVPEGAWENWLG